MEQGYHIAVANSVAMLGFVTKDNVLMKALSSTDVDVHMEGSPSDYTSQSLSSFRNAQGLSNSTLKIVLQRIGDPDVLPFIHVTLVFMFNMSRHSAMSFLQADFPWDLLLIMLNALLASYGTASRIENDKFPLPKKDDVRPLLEDFAMRSLLWTESYFPKERFTNEKIDEEEKYHELPSMTAEHQNMTTMDKSLLTDDGPDNDYMVSTIPRENMSPPGHWKKGWGVLVRLIYAFGDAGITRGFHRISMSR